MYLKVRDLAIPMEGGKLTKFVLEKVIEKIQKRGIFSQRKITILGNEFFVQPNQENQSQHFTVHDMIKSNKFLLCCTFKSISRKTDLQDIELNYDGIIIG